MIINKVKVHGDTIIVSFLRTVAGGRVEEHDVKYPEAPLPSFTDALAALGKYVCEICELPDSYRMKAFRMSSVSFKWYDDILGANLTAVKSVENASGGIALNTPHKTEKPIGKNADPKFCFTKDCAKALRTLLDEVTKYVDGERLQTDMFNKDPSVPTDEDVAKARAHVVKTQRASVCSLHRALKIGFPMAVFLMERLEADGVIAPANGAEPREILVKE